LIFNPPEIGYPDEKLPNDLLIKNQTPHNLYEARISTASELSGDLHGHRKFSKKEYDWDNTLPSATQVFLTTLTNAPQRPISSKPATIDQPTDPQLVFVKPPAQVHNTVNMGSPFNNEITMMLNPLAFDVVSDESSINLLVGYNLSPTSSMTLTTSPVLSPPSSPPHIPPCVCRSPTPYSPSPSSPYYTPPKYSSTSSKSLSDQIPMRDTHSLLKMDEPGYPLKFEKSPLTSFNSQ
jgi:hypothetical protein